MAWRSKVNTFGKYLLAGSVGALIGLGAGFAIHYASWKEQSKSQEKAGNIRSEQDELENTLQETQPRATEGSTLELEIAWSEYAGCLAETAYAKHKADLYCWHPQDAPAYLECRIAIGEYEAKRQACLGAQAKLKQISDNDGLVD